MKRLKLAALAVWLLPFCSGTALSADAPAGTTAATVVPLVMLVVDATLYFDGADGKPIQLAIGSYAVTSEANGAGLRLTDGGGNSVVVPAQAAKHEQQLTQPQALIVAVGDDARHLVLLQPDGSRLEAIGSASGVRSRGGLTRQAMVSNVDLQRATVSMEPVLVAAPPAPAAAPPAPAAAPPVAISKSDIRQNQRQRVAPPPALVGWADLHTHPMVHLGYGGKLIHGGVDIGTLLPTTTDPRCANGVRAVSAAQALGDDRPSHGGWDANNFPCGNDIRKNLIGALQLANGALVTAGLNKPPTIGFPVFNTWPAWNDITHQKMWWEWIRRARDGGQRVMVALAVNNRTLAEAIQADGPRNDRVSADLQIAEIKAFVARHPDFMEVALSSSDVERIARGDPSKNIPPRIAVVLGLEIDNIGDFNDRFPNAAAQNANLPMQIPAEIQRLYNQGVRYVIPIHVVDNVFGGTAVYQAIFNVADYRETGHYWILECAAPTDGITFQFNTYNSNVSWLVNPLKIGAIPPPSPQCAGHRNALPLSNWGVLAIKEMMKRGMIIDIDHMSTKAVDQALAIAEQVAAPGYPIVSGHSGVRGLNGNAENSRSPAQLARIARLHGMFGLGTDATSAAEWLKSYHAAIAAMNGQSAYQNGAIGFGTDLNGLVRGPRPGGAVEAGFNLPPSSFAGTPKVWNYSAEGVAHYGMLPEFVSDVRRQGPPPNGLSGADLIDNHFNRSADYFWRMWQQAEAQSRFVQ